ncbi:MAG: PDZ domain-containing protein [Gemmatimonadales bacterium]
MRFGLLVSLVVIAPSVLPAQQRPSPAVTSITYEVTFDRSTAKRRTVQVAMAFTANGGGEVLLSLPAWTPGAYELTDFAKWVSGFTPTQNGKELGWDKLDYDTWRLRGVQPGPVRVAFDFRADTIDNAMSWSRDDFLLFNGTNLFLYPENQGFDWPATVTVKTEPDWLVATGMIPTGPRTFREGNYHDLVDKPFFVGRFDLDSTSVPGVTLRLASYPAGSVTGAARQELWERYRSMWRPMTEAFGDTPMTSYTVMQIADSSYKFFASGLEHQNSHVNVLSPAAVGDPVLNQLYAHETVHAWNVKRLRPSDLWPYRYDRPQPTTWLWVSEGITDYYSDLVLVRSGVRPPGEFYDTQIEKMDRVASAPPVALEDASLSTWIHPVDGTNYIYYAKGSLAGLMLDVMIRDASDNRRSLDDVMRSLYRTDYKQGKGFTAEEWWKAVSTAAGGKSFADFNAKYVDGREPYPWDQVLPLAGLRFVREPRLGVGTREDSTGVWVESLVPGSAAELAGLEVGDQLLKVGDVEITNQEFGPPFRARYASAEGQTITIMVKRGGETKSLPAKIRFAVSKIEEDPTANAKAVRIREGLLKGMVEK